MLFNRISSLLVQATMATLKIFLWADLQKKKVPFNLIDPRTANATLSRRAGQAERGGRAKAYPK
jgi:hypothetical protein